MAINAKPFNRSSFIVVLKYVLSLRNEEKERSAVAVVTGSVAMICYIITFWNKTNEAKMCHSVLLPAIAFVYWGKSVLKHVQ